MFLMISLTITVCVITYYYVKFKRAFRYFSDRGIPHEEPMWIIGSKTTLKIMTGQSAFAEHLDEIHGKFKNERFFGYYAFTNPMLVINDLELAKNILIKDFDHFSNQREIVMNEKKQKYMANMLFVVNGEKWKRARNILTPVFTSGKLRAMCSFIHQCNLNLVEELKNKADNGEIVDAKYNLKNYAMDVIGHCGFGLNVNSFKEPNGKFQKMSRKFTGEEDPYAIVKFSIAMFLPKFLVKLINLDMLNREACEWLTNILKTTMVMRKEKKIRTGDFIDTLSDALESARNENGEVDEETEDLIFANGLVLFLAGFDTTSTMAAVATYYLAKEPHIQETLHSEISQLIEDNGGPEEELNYDQIQSLTYLDQFLYEVMRMYTLTPIERRCTKRYKIPDTDIVIEKDQMVQFVASKIQKDDSIYADPEKFDPDNFLPEVKNNRNMFAFLTFGQGPRNCIGSRFALMQMKAVLIALIANFKILPSDKLPEKLRADPNSFSSMPIGGIHIKLEKRRIE